MKAAHRPKRILIVRHAEKRGDPAHDDATDGDDLSPRGRERAAALAPYLVAAFGKPDALFATRASHHSNRPVETLTPLAQALGLAIEADYADADYAALAQRILGDGEGDHPYAGKKLLICWHHGHIPALTRALGGRPPVDPWPGAVFDRVWQLDLADGADGAAAGEAGSTGLPVLNLPQRLMFGDEPA